MQYTLNSRQVLACKSCLNIPITKYWLRGCISRQCRDFFLYNVYGKGCVLSATEQPTSKTSAINYWISSTESISSHVFMRLEFSAFLTQFCTVYWCEIETGWMIQKENPMQGKNKNVKLSFNQKYDTNELDNEERDGVTEQ